MTILFKAKSEEAYIIKNLVSLLYENIKQGFFRLTKDGIFLRQEDNNSHVLVDLVLEQDKFQKYKIRLNDEKDMFIGITLSHLHQPMKSIKKKDSVSLYIDDQSPNDLYIKDIPKDTSGRSTSVIKIQETQNIIMELPDGYGRPIIVSGPEFQKMCKKLDKMQNSVKVIANEFVIKFICDTGGIIKQEIELGDEVSDDDDDSESPEFRREYSTERLSRLSKLSGLSSSVQIFPGEPLLFRAQVGELGHVSLYVKSNQRLEEESCAYEDEVSDDE